MPTDRPPKSSPQGGYILDFNSYFILYFIM